MKVERAVICPSKTEADCQGLRPESPTAGWCEHSFCIESLPSVIFRYIYQQRYLEVRKIVTESPLIPTPSSPCLCSIDSKLRTAPLCVFPLPNPWVKKLLILGLVVLSWITLQYLEYIFSLILIIKAFLLLSSTRFGKNPVACWNTIDFLFLGGTKALTCNWL